MEAIRQIFLKNLVFPYKNLVFRSENLVFRSKKLVFQCENWIWIEKLSISI